jgi:hypothetical protein
VQCQRNQRVSGACGALKTVSQRARELTGLSHQATDLAAQGESDRAVGTLQQILKDAEGTETLAEISRRKLHEIHSPLPVMPLPD